MARMYYAVEDTQGVVPVQFFADGEVADAVCANCNKGQPEGRYVVVPLTAKPQSQAEKDALRKLNEWKREKAETLYRERHPQLYARELAKLRQAVKDAQNAAFSVLGEAIHREARQGIGEPDCYFCRRIGVPLTSVKLPDGVTTVAACLDCGEAVANR